MEILCRVSMSGRRWPGHISNRKTTEAADVAAYFCLKGLLNPERCHRRCVLKHYIVQRRANVAVTQLQGDPGLSTGSRQGA
jgi:hypothetical protein